MKRVLLLFAMVAATVVSANAQNEYFGQPLVFKLASGDSLIAEMSVLGLKPRVENGEIVWNLHGRQDFVVKDVKSINLRPHKQAEAMARQALIKFYKAMDGDHWTNNTNWCSNKPLDEWFGVSMSDRSYVWTLNLKNNNLKGTLPADNIFMDMGPIASIYLSENNISGKFPKAWAKNTTLQHLFLFQNKISGELPDQLFHLPFISSVRIEENKMTGPIPPGVSRMMNNNVQLMMSGNDFSGDVPEEIINHPRFNLIWNDIIPQGGHLNVPTIPGYRLTVEDTNGNQFETTDIYKNNFYTLTFNYYTAKSSFTDKLKIAYDKYKHKGFEVLGMAPADYESINEYLHTNDISWLNLNPESFSAVLNSFYAYYNFINLIDQNGNVVFTSIMDETGKMEDVSGPGTRDQMVFDVLAEKFGAVDFTPYTSTDYSRDGEVIKLQKASVGKGVDIVFMGNGFVDKDMAPGGLYEQKMTQAMEQFFALEPYTSLRKRFNVYAVKAVSPNNQMYGDYKMAINYDTDAFNYAQKVKDLIPDRPMRINIIYNTFNAGRSFTTMYDDGSYLAFMMTGVNRLINHEGGGHGVGLLYDEYVEHEGSTASQDVKNYYEQMWTEFGRGANIDMHSQVSKTRWARFAADSRYAAEELGAYEGSGTYQYGIYRPTQNSMMRFNDIPFNAPSREAIYKKVMQESEGSKWKYDYEKFVTFDANGRAQFAEALSKPAAIKKADSSEVNITEKDKIVDRPSLTRPPVSIKGTWRDALLHPTPISELGAK